MDRDVIRVAKRRPPAGDATPDESRAFACCLVGFVLGVLVSGGSVLLWWAIR